MPVKDALGRDVHVDYGEDIVNVRDILDATNARKNIFNDSVEFQKLSLKQIALIYTYESDAKQVIVQFYLNNILLNNISFQWSISMSSISMRYLYVKVFRL